MAWHALSEHANCKLDPYQRTGRTSPLEHPHHAITVLSQLSHTPKLSTAHPKRLSPCRLSIRATRKLWSRTGRRSYDETIRRSTEAMRKLENSHRRAAVIRNMTRCSQPRGGNPPSPISKVGVRNTPKASISRRRASAREIQYISNIEKGETFHFSRRSLPSTMDKNLPSEQTLPGVRKRMRESCVWKGFVFFLQPPTRTNILPRTMAASTLFGFRLYFPIMAYPNFTWRVDKIGSQKKFPSLHFKIRNIANSPEKREKMERTKNNDSPR